MKPEQNFRAEAALDDEAAGWLCEREEGFAPGRAQAFSAWQRCDPRHAAAVGRVERTLALLDDMSAVRTPLEARVGRVEASKPIPTREQRRGFPVPLWAAALAAAFVIGFVAWWLPSRPAIDREHYATDGAVQRRIALRDGSVVDLNRGSELEVEFFQLERRVTLRAGEAHFQVAPDAGRPFIVSAGGVAVRAVGTAFNVQLASAEVAVLVTEGKVQVQRERHAASSRANDAEVATATLLTASERTVVPLAVSSTPVMPAVERVSADRVRALLAWQNPVTTFTDVPLREVVLQFNRRNVTQLVLADAALGERKIGGVIALDQVEAFVRLLEQEGDVVASSRGEHEIVLRRVR
jgi:transmembrane sensor